MPSVEVFGQSDNPKLRGCISADEQAIELVLCQRFHNSRVEPGVVVMNRLQEASGATENTCVEPAAAAAAVAANPV
jgi:hypothetical protein